jgi:tetratricopeptide (TPR) repeat protein
MKRSANRRGARISRAPVAVASLLLAAALLAQPSEPVDADAGASALQLRRARDGLMNASDFTAARGPAERLVKEYSSDASYAADLVALGRIQTELGELDDAETSLLQGIDLLRAADGEFSIRLVEPYHYLGRSYIKAGRYPEAITALEQAQHVSQRNLGLFNVEQARLIDDITTAYLGLGDTVEARRMQLERLDNAVKRFGPDDPRVIPFRYQLADYYQRSRMPVSAREQYEQVLRSQESQLGTEHPGLLSPLRQLVKIDLVVGQGDDDAAYRRLVSILDGNPQVDTLERGLSLATLGDWATVSGDPAAARDYYRRAWDALSARPELDAAAFFAEPVMLDFIAPLSPVDRGTRSQPYSWGSMVFELDVSAEGRALNVEAVGTAGEPSALATRYTRRLRETHFRPRLVDGEPAALSDVQFTHYFRYYVDDAADERG